MSARRLARRAAAALALLALAPGQARAQDFVAPAPGYPRGSPLALLETGLGGRPGAIAIEAATTTRSGLPELTTRAVALAVLARGALLAAGLSQTGDPELGWTAVGMALGGAGARAGATVRATARRDRHPAPADGPLGPGIGAEAGAAAWARAGPGLTLWAEAPQIWTRGMAPPLARTLALGAGFGAGDVRAWLIERTPPRGAIAAGHEAGLALALGPALAWARATDDPPRAAIGIEARVRLIAVAATIESHPVLGETATLGLALRSRGAPP